VEFLLAVSILLVCHAYFGYPFSLWAIGVFRSRPVRRGAFHPPVTFLITAHNEGASIREKLKNTLQLRYPGDALQILVASDGSTDDTNDIVREYSDHGGVELLEIHERGGKERAQKVALENAQGEIVVFSDVATRIDPGGLEQIISNFADPSVGCVSSQDVLIGRDGRPSGEGFYVRYEMMLRRLETRVHSLVGLSGSFFAARREVCKDFSPEMQSDFRTLLNSIKMGLRGVTDPNAVGYYTDVSDPQREFERKVRTVVRGLTVFFRHLDLLNPFRFGLFSYQLFCHKLLRWLVPFWLVTALVSNFFLMTQSMFLFALLLGQIIFYGTAIWGWAADRWERSVLIKIPTFFVMVNASIAAAWVQYLSGRRVVMWKPSTR